MYYDDYTAIIVPAERDAVYDAVMQLSQERRDPEQIRRRTLNRINRSRYEFARQIAKIRLQFNGSTVSPEAIMQNLFFGKDNFRHRYVSVKSSSRKAQNIEKYTFHSEQVLFYPASGGELEKRHQGYVVSGTNFPLLEINEPAAHILSQLDGRTSVDKIIANLNSQFGENRGIEVSVRDMIATFIGHGVLCW